MYEEMIPIVMFVVIGVIVIAYYYWNHKNRLSVTEVRPFKNRISRESI